MPLLGCRSLDYLAIAAFTPQGAFGFYAALNDGNILRCHLCEYRYCVVCEVGMHDGETCDAYQRRLQTQDRAKEDLLSAQAVRSHRSLVPSAVQTSINTLAATTLPVWLPILVNPVEHC